MMIVNSSETSASRRPDFFDAEVPAHLLVSLIATALKLNASRPWYAAPAGAHVYTHRIDGQDHITNRQIEHALHARSQAHHHTASGPANHRDHQVPVRYV